MKKTSLVLTLIVGVLLSATSAWAQAPLPKVRLEGLPMLSLAAANLPVQSAARDDLPRLKEVQRGRRWIGAGSGLLAAAIIQFATYTPCTPYQRDRAVLVTPTVLSSLLAVGGLGLVIGGGHRVRSAGSEARRGNAFKRFVAPTLLGILAGGVAGAVTLGASFPEAVSKCSD